MIPVSRSPARGELIWLRVAAAAVILWLGLLMFAGKAGWQHAGLIALAWACLTRRPEPRRFVREWWLMIAFWVSYDGMRLLEPWLLPRVAVQAPLRWEKVLFCLPSGEILPFYFAGLSCFGPHRLLIRFLQIFCSLVYMTQLWAIPAVTLAIWLRHGDALFRRIVRSFTALHIMTLTVYLGFPAAPPWWVYENGFRSPSLAHSFPQALAGNRMLSALFHLSANRFAAIPSLHAAYPLLLSLILAAHGVGRSYVILSCCYTLSMWFSCVFLNQHYVVDLLSGALLAGVAVGITWQRVKPPLCRDLDRSRTRISSEWRGFFRASREARRDPRLPNAFPGPAESTSSRFPTAP